MIGRITCTVSSGTARLEANGGHLGTRGVSQTKNGDTATLVVNVDSFQNRGLYYTDPAANFYLFISGVSKYIYVHGYLQRNLIIYQTP